MIYAVGPKHTQPATYCGRPRVALPLGLGNPVIVNRQCGVCGAVHTLGGATLPCYTRYLRAVVRKQKTDEDLDVLARVARSCVWQIDPDATRDQFYGLVARCSHEDLHLKCWCLQQPHRVTPEDSPDSYICHAQILGRAVLLVSRR